MARALFALVSLLSACSGGDRGAVVVRWRLIDSTTGSPASSACGVQCAIGTSLDGSFCCASVGGRDILIDHVELVAIPLGSDGGAVAADCKSCRFACNPSESTTQFELTPGDYLLSLRAVRCGLVVGNTPPGVIRTVRAAEITNLNAVEVLLMPPPMNPLVSCSTADGGSATPVCH